jgi:hypothetical protein
MIGHGLFGQRAGLAVDRPVADANRWLAGGARSGRNHLGHDQVRKPGNLNGTGSDERRAGQIATTLRIEHRRITREARAFYVTLEAAMAIVIEDVAGARAIFQGPDDNSFSQMAYEARQRIKKSIFPELRTTLLHLGGQLTSLFLSLENRIDNFSAQWIPAQAPTSGLQYRNGRHAGLILELDQIELEAKSLQEEASAAINAMPG